MWYVLGTGLQYCALEQAREASIISFIPMRQLLWKGHFCLLGGKANLFVGYGFEDVRYENAMII